MSDDLELKKDILFLYALPDIVDDKGYPLGCLSVGHDTDMEDTFSEIPGDKISRVEVIRVFRDFNGRTTSLEKLHQIRDTSVVDIRIRCLQAPLPGIERKIGFHVFVYELLEVDIELPKCSDENICATAGFDWDISPWIF